MREYTRPICQLSFLRSRATDATRDANSGPVSGRRELGASLWKLLRGKGMLPERKRQSRRERLPARDPLRRQRRPNGERSRLAKAAATLDVLSGGRVELGLGAGAFREGIEAMGGPGRSRGESVEALEEAVQIVRAYWKGDRTLRFDGKYYVVKGARPGPRPAHPIGLWLGSYGPRSLGVLGRLADGWLPSSSYAPPERFAIEVVPAVQEQVVRLFKVEVGNQMSDRIAAFPPYKPGGEGFGVAVCHGQHFFGMDHSIGRHRQRAGDDFGLVKIPRSFLALPFLISPGLRGRWCATISRTS